MCIVEMFSRFIQSVFRGDSTPQQRSSRHVVALEHGIAIAIRVDIFAEAAQHSAAQSCRPGELLERTRMVKRHGGFLILRWPV
ncbi:MAG: hypothetical protein OEQ29_17675 [Alphaproteobacteria bacterium]|nr:hypothetical protein [Alphaproteobacteria bacterium]